VDRPWVFVAGTPLDGLAREIAAEMVNLFGVSGKEAIGRINRAWGHLTEFSPIVFHKPATYWAQLFYYGDAPCWWISNENERARRNLPPLVPVPYP
jgi:hypothetical protein